MANKYYLQSAQDNLVFDIKVPVKSGSALQALIQKNEPNQLWSFEGVPDHTGLFYITSNDQGLVVDIKTPVSSGSLLQALIRKTESNQWWKFQPVANKPGYFHIVSADDALVVDIKDPVSSGSPLQALIQKSELNQWWKFVSASGNQFNPQISPPSTFIQLDPPEPASSFVVSGSGYFPGRPLTFSWIYTETGDSLSTSDSVTIDADAGGDFVTVAQLPQLASSTGTLGIELTDTVTGKQETEEYYWNGLEWSAT